MTAAKKPDQEKAEATEKKARAVKPPLSKSFRSVKPPLSNYSSILLDGLDFFNFNRGKAYEPERKLIETMIPLLRQMLPDDMQVMDKGLFKWTLPWAQDKSKMDYLWLTQRNCKWLLSGFAKPDPFQFEILGNWPQEALSGLSLVVKNGNPPFVELDVIPDVDPAGDPAETFRRTWNKGFRARLVKLIFDAFQPFGDGPFYIGCCPRCSAFFKMSRGDQVYDRELCKREFTRKK